MAAPMKALLAVIGVCAGLSGCAMDGDDVTGGDDSTSSVQQAGFGNCEAMVCGSNSPCLSDQTPCDGFFHELPMIIGMQNTLGYEMRGMNVGGVWYNLSVVDGELSAVKDGYAPITGAALINKVFRVRGPDGTVYLIKIKAHSMQAYSPAGTGSTHAYNLAWTILGDADPVEHNICSHPEDLDGEYDTLWQDKWTTVLFEGERYNADTKTVSGYNDLFFNIGCAGNVLAKMHLTHHSSVSSTGAYTTTWQERQTMLKMYSADYCGDGSSFTEFGESLSWKDNHGWFSHYYQPLSTITLEARWGPDGAICLESPRMTGVIDLVFPYGVDDAIDAQCPTTRPPTCSSLGQSTNVAQLYGTHLVTAYPP
jgi:hypothetical protein